MAPSPTKPLAWEDGKLAALGGKDLAGVAKLLTDAELDFWRQRMNNGVLPYELGILDAEAQRRGTEFFGLELFR